MHAAKHIRFSSHSQPPIKKITINSITSLYKRDIPISVMTAHDYPSATILHKAKIDICLVGDSLAMVALGYKNTNEITLDEMIHHSKAVSRGNHHSFLLGDLPFGTYETSPDQALDNSIKFIKLGLVEGVKLEGGIEVAPQVAKITRFGIPVMGHIGLTPQRACSLGGFRVQGKTVEKAKRLLEDALALEEAGAFSIVLEAMPTLVAKFITKRVKIPTIGIGAGPYCSGQVLVYQDMMGTFDRFLPRFCKVYAEGGKGAENAMMEYKKEVLAGQFPDLKQHCYDMASLEEEERFKDFVADIECRENSSI